MNNIVTLVRDGCDRATAYHQANKIVRVDNGYYVTWLDSQFRCVVAHVANDGQLRGPVALAQGLDNHCGGAITRTPDGTLHFVSGSHSHGFVYRSSRTPLVAESWSLPQGVGRSATYPSLVHDCAGNLHLAHRYSGNTPLDHWGVCWYTTTPPSPWQWPSTSLVRMPAPLYSFPTNALAVGADGTLHLLVEWYKTWADGVTPAHSVGVSHLERPAGGNWQHTDGRAVKLLPVTFEDTQPFIANAAGNPRPGNVAVLPDHQPCFGCWDQDAGTLLLSIRGANREWRTVDLSPQATQLDPGNVCNGEPQVAVNASGDIVLVAPRAKSTTWGEPTSQIHVYWIDPATGNIKRHRALEKKQSAEPDWLPSIEKPGPGDYPAELGLIYQTGRRGTRATDIVPCAVNLTVLR